MDTSPTIQMGRLQNPQIIRIEVAFGHREPCVLFFVKIKCSELSAIFIIFCLFLLLEYLNRFQFLDRQLEVLRRAGSLALPEDPAELREQFFL